MEKTLIDVLGYFIFFYFYSKPDNIIFMKAAIIRRENRKKKIELEIIKKPTPGPYEVLIKVMYCSVTLFDYQTLSDEYELKTNTIIPGNETVGFVDKVGDNVHKVEKGDYVTIYPWIFCGECDMCLSGKENYCRKRSIIGRDFNGCYAEYLVAPEKNIFKLPKKIDPQLAATLPYDALTAYHAINNLDIKIGDQIVVFKASSDIGLYLTQLIKLKGGYVIGVSEEKWIKEYGADISLSLNKLEKYIKKNDIHIKYILDPSITNLLKVGFDILDADGIYVILNNIYKEKAVIDLDILVNKGITLIGSSGGTVNDLTKVIELADKKLIKPKIWRIYPLSHVQEALHALFSKDKKGEILLRL